jgi:hypothetical protein
MVRGQRRLDAYVSTRHPHLLHSLPLSPWSTSQSWSSLLLFLPPGDPSPRHLFLTFPLNLPRMRNLRVCLVLSPVVLPPRALVHLRPRVEEAHLSGLGEGVCLKPPLPSLLPSPACSANPPRTAFLANLLQLWSPLPPPRSSSTSPRTQTRVPTTSGPLQDHMRTTSRPHLDHIWTTSGPRLDHIWTTSGPHLDHMRIT